MEKRNENKILWPELIIYVLSRIVGVGSVIVVVTTVCYLILKLAEK